MEAYNLKEVLGEGTWGIVYLATQKKTDRIVAIKKIKLGKYKDGVNFTALREVKLLTELKHPNIIELVDVFSKHDMIHLVFDYMETDLETVIMDRATVLSAADVKSYMLMLLQGLEFCHQNFVLHRDLKPNNLLSGADGVMKLADFGLARFYGSPGRQMTHQVVTRWYRAPELLFGAREYGGAVDVWACGAMLAELLLRRPLFPGVSEADQIGKVFHIMGTPTEENWPGHALLPLHQAFQPCPPMDLARLLAGASPDAVDLCRALLRLDPARRPTCAQALAHPYFANPPAPTAPSKLPRPRPPDRVSSGPEEAKKADDDVSPKKNSGDSFEKSGQENGHPIKRVKVEVAANGS